MQLITMLNYLAKEEYIFYAYEYVSCDATYSHDDDLIKLVCMCPGPSSS